MRIHIIYTGGTIGMVPSPNGLVPGNDLPERLNSLLPLLAAGTTTTFSELAPLIDSANATPGSWQQVVDEVRAQACSSHPPAGYLVLHGTDTLAYTGAALSFALTDLAAPVVVTGAQLPLGAAGSDALGNISSSLHALAQAPAPGVGLCFAGRLLQANRATKRSSWSLEGFDSPNAPALALAGAPWRWGQPAPKGPGWPDPKPYTPHDVVVLDLVPGLGAKRLEALLSPLPKAVVLRAYGVGNVPDAEPGLVEVVNQVVEAGTTVVVASQCHQGQVELGRYGTGAAVLGAGAVGAGDMTLEATYAKLQFLASQGLVGAQLAAAVGRPIAGEITVPQKA